MSSLPFELPVEQPIIDAAQASVAGLSKDEQICDHHDTWDELLQPTGPACGKPAKFLIIWKESKQVSLACQYHAAHVDPRAPEHIVSRLVEPRG